MDTDGDIEAIDVTGVDGQLGELLAKIAGGGRLRLVRNGVPVALLSAEPPPRVPLTTEGLDRATARMPVRAADLAAATAGMSYQAETAGDFMRRLRDDARY